MYGPVFETMFSGSMLGCGPVRFVLLTYCIACCDRNGRLELNEKLLAFTFGCTEEEVHEAIEFLCSPDEESRSEAEEGRRLVHEGAFMYRLVNKAQYVARMSKASKAEYNKGFMAGMRAAEKGSAPPPELEKETGEPPEKKKKKRGVFKPPTAEEVQAYIDEKGLEVVPSVFIDFYESKGWMVGKGKMKDWKASCRRSVDWDQMQSAYQKLKKAGPQHVGSSPSENGGWMYDTHRRADFENHGNHSMWEAYADAAADLPPKTAPTFDDWLLENMTPEG